ncbi:carbonic anhydrase [Candidatus Micrarchaeota archaeon]|nr:carbonic anhydrase [Candidatus Micrarchaeota archaeon]
MDELDRLLNGNKRFASGQLESKNIVKRREELKDGQKPYAIVLTCSDSRVAPEFIFDTNLGDIFVIRTAGNVVDPIALGSIEYAAGHLHSRLLVVMGHSKCGAVTAAYEDHREGNITSIVDKIKPAVQKVKKARGEKVEVEECVKENSRCVVEDIRNKSEIIRHLEKEGKLKVVCAEYYLENGKVEVLS